MQTRYDDVSVLLLRWEDDEMNVSILYDQIQHSGIASSEGRATVVLRCISLPGLMLDRWSGSLMTLRKYS
jgi:hypothetical protein